MQSHRAKNSIYPEIQASKSNTWWFTTNYLEHCLIVWGYFLVQSDLVPDTPIVSFFFDILMEDSYSIDACNKPLNTMLL